MEFEGETPKPPPLQDSKEYYKNTQRMSEAMIKNPQFQIFSISEDERESMVTSLRETINGEENSRITVDSIDVINQYGQTPQGGEQSFKQ